MSGLSCLYIQKRGPWWFHRSSFFRAHWQKGSIYGCDYKKLQKSYKKLYNDTNKHKIQKNIGCSSNAEHNNSKRFLFFVGVRQLAFVTFRKAVQNENKIRAISDTHHLLRPPPPQSTTYPPSILPPPYFAGWEDG